MNILLISPLPPPAGGIASWTKRFVDYNMEKKQNELYIVNTAVIGKRVTNLAESNFCEELVRTLNIFREFNKSTKRCHIDIVHLNSPCGRLGLIRDFLLALNVKIHNIPLVTHFRCDVSYMVRDRISLFFLKQLVRISDTIISLNTPSQIFIQKTCKRNSVIIPNFISGKYIHSAKETKRIKEKAKRVIYVGQIRIAKGCDLILKLAERMPEFQFVMVGPLQEDMNQLPAMNNLELINEIPFECVINELNNADLFIFPTKTEGFPNAVSEAMACGLPIISTPVGAIPDMIEQEGGVLVNVNDIAGFEEAILKLSDSEVLRKRMSEWNKNKVLNAYTIDRVYNTIIHNYQLTINNKK